MPCQVTRLASCVPVKQNTDVYSVHRGHISAPTALQMLIDRSVNIFRVGEIWEVKYQIANALFPYCDDSN